MFDKRKLIVKPLITYFSSASFYFLSQRFRESSWHTISKTLRARDRKIHTGQVHVAL